MLRGNWGVYATAEQCLWREHPGDDAAQGMGAFLRLGASPGEASLVSSYVEAGLVWRGLVPGRDDEECGVAFVQGRLHGELRQLARDLYRFIGATGPLPDHETLLEACHRAVLRPGWTAQPTFEWILHPGGSATTQDAVVIGLRTVIEF
jgi:porin